MGVVKVYDTTGSRAVMDTPDGDVICDKIKKYFDAGEDVVLDFENVDTILSMFLNSAVAPLYEEYSSEYLQRHLSVANISEEDKVTMKRVNARAKQFYQEKRLGSEFIEGDIYGEN